MSGSTRPSRSRRMSPIEQVLHAQTEPPRPIAIGRADAATGGADGGARQPRLVGLIERDVVRHDHVRAAADPHARDVDAARHEHVELVDQRHRVDHDAVADDRRDVRVEHARRREPELEHLVAADDRVAGVVAALVAHDHRGLLRQEIGRLALALVAPLQADDHGCGHQAPSPNKKALIGPWVDCSLVAPPTCRRIGGWSLDRLTERPMRPTRAIVDLLVRGARAAATRTGGV